MRGKPRQTLFSARLRNITCSLFIPTLELETVLRRQKLAVLIDHPLVEGATGGVRIDFYEAARRVG